jgi:hypothetical protein
MYDVLVYVMLLLRLDISGPPGKWPPWSVPVFYQLSIIKCVDILGGLQRTLRSRTDCSSLPYTHNSNRNTRDKFTLLLLSTRLACTRINNLTTQKVECRVLVYYIYQ